MDAEKLEKALAVQNELNGVEHRLFQQMWSLIGEMSNDMATLGNLMLVALPAFDFQGRDKAMEIIAKHEAAKASFSKLFEENPDAN